MRTKIKPNNSKIRIGAGAGFAGDRLEPAIELIQKASLDFIIFECLAERTIARETLALIRGMGTGYNPQLNERFNATLKICEASGTRIVTNMGAANPKGAALETTRIANDLNLKDCRCAVLLGDDVCEIIERKPDLIMHETGKPLESIISRLASANAYLGADSVADAISTGAPIIMTGRVADPSLFVAPMLDQFGWSYDDYSLLGQFSIAGHLLECAGQVTGGYFADPGFKEVSNLANLGFPFVDVTNSGKVYIGKLENTGGRLDKATCTEQILYEVGDPSNYITPDCVLDITDVHLKELHSNRIEVHGARANPRTSSYKVSVGYFDGYLGEGQLTYGGPNAVARAKLAIEIVKKRLQIRGFNFEDIQTSLIGLDSLHGPRAYKESEPYEVRLRVAGKTQSKKAAEAVGFEVAALYTNGPYGGAGDYSNVRELIAVQSVFLERELVKPRIEIIG